MSAIAFAEEVLAMSREISYLRKEVARLRHYEAEYNTLVCDSIRHSNKMMTNTLGIVMTPGVSEALRVAAQLPEGFAPWAGGERPVDKCIRVQLLLRNGDMPSGAACDCRWLHSGNGEDIVGYRVIEGATPGIPEGFTHWAGGTCPVPFDARVEVIFRAGSRDTGCPAPIWHWGHCGGDHDIIAYRLVAENLPKAEIPEGFTPWSGGECPVDGLTKVQILLRCGATSTGAAYACRWPHLGNDDDIIAYKVVT